MTTPTPDLKAAALAATPGEWRAGNKVPHYVYSAGGDPICQCDSMDELPRLEECRNAAFIAAANPATILAMIAELEDVKAKLARRKDYSGVQDA